MENRETELLRGMLGAGHLPRWSAISRARGFGGLMIDLMRMLAATFCGLAALCGTALAQQHPVGAPEFRSAATPVQEVVNANPEANGKAYRLDLLLKNGRKVSYEISPPEASKITDGLSKPATAGAQHDQVAQLVYGMMIQADPQGRAVIITPRNSSGNLQALAVPLTGADELLEVLKAKIAEAKAFAAKQSDRTAPKQ